MLVVRLALGAWMGVVGCCDDDDDVRWAGCCWDHVLGAVGKCREGGLPAFFSAVFSFASFFLFSLTRSSPQSAFVLAGVTYVHVHLAACTLDRAITRCWLCIVGGRLGWARLRAASRVGGSHPFAAHLF